MSKLTVLCGLPASGKSTFAQELEDETSVILSSDDIRKELFDDINHQDSNKKVFETMNQRAQELLKQGKNVIYDATNINRKRRVHLINNVLKADEYIVYYFNKHISNVKFNNLKRERVVPEHVIDNMYKTMQIPVKNEGWDKVYYVSGKNKYLSRFAQEYEELILRNDGHDKIFNELSVFIIEFEDIFNLSQDSKYHSFSVSRHTYHVYEEVLQNYNGKNKMIMLWTSLFHDVGKAFCKSFINYKGERNRYASFIGHEFVSSQLAAYHLDKIGYEKDYIQKVVALVQFHMYPMKAGEKKMRQINKFLGEELYSDLLFLHEADKKAK